MERDELLSRLEEKLRMAREWRARASAAFDSAIQDLRTGDPNRAERLRTASKEYTLALEQVNVALREYNDFAVFKKEPKSESAPKSNTQPGEKAR